MAESDRAAYDRYVAAWNSRNGDQVASAMTSDATLEDVTIGQVHHGSADIKAFAEYTFTVLPTYRLEVESFVSDGSGFASQWRLSGDGVEAQANLPKVDKPWTIRGASVGRLADGKVAENHDYWDMAGLLVQLGVLPAPAI